MRATPKPLLLFFSSSRSGPCRRLESVLAHVARKERDRLRILHVDVDVDEHEDVAFRFGIRSVPTLVLVHEKRAVCRLEGRISSARIEAALDEHTGAPAVA